MRGDLLALDGVSDEEDTDRAAFVGVARMALGVVAARAKFDASFGEVTGADGGAGAEAAGSSDKPSPPRGLERASISAMLSAVITEVVWRLIFFAAPAALLRRLLLAYPLRRLLRQARYRDSR